MFASEAGNWGVIQVSIVLASVRIFHCHKKLFGNALQKHNRRKHRDTIKILFLVSKALLRYGAKTESHDERRWTSLILSSEVAHLPIVKVCHVLFNQHTEEQCSFPQHRLVRISEHTLVS